MKTRKGIYYNLKESEYFFKLDGVTFYFSSALHLNKFLAQYPQNRDKRNRIYKNLFNINYTNNVQSDLYLYEHIEKRGFYIVTDKGEATCRSQITLIGQALNIQHN